MSCASVDIVLAMNFSYWIFKTRDLLRRYFRNVYAGLLDDGLFMLDAVGGSDAHREMRDRTKLKRFTYIWDQKAYNLVNGDRLCHIHFSFPDGSKIQKAFTYDFRLWTLPEIRELLLEAGFQRATVSSTGRFPQTHRRRSHYPDLQRRPSRWTFNSESPNQRL